MPSTKQMITIFLIASVAIAVSNYIPSYGAILGKR